MELKIINQKENPLFNRKEIEFNSRAEVTPSKQEVQKLISEKLSAPIEAIKLKGIHGKFGSKNFTIKANIYNSIEDKERIEPKSKKEKEIEKKTIEAISKNEVDNVDEKAVEKTKAPEEKPVEQPPEPKPEPEQEVQQEKVEEKPEEKNVNNTEEKVTNNKPRENGEQQDNELKPSENKSEPSGEANKEE